MCIQSNSTMTQITTNAPTSNDIRAAMDSFCSKELLSDLVREDKTHKSRNVQKETPHDDVIVVDRKSKAHRDRDDATRNNWKYAQEFRRNRFYQFKGIRDTRNSFFGLQSDEELVTTVPNRDTT